MFEVTSLYLIPISRSLKGRIYVCDICERTIEDDESIGDIKIGGWDQDDWFAKLWSKLEPDEVVPDHDPNGRERIESLLSATEIALSLSQVDVGAGLITGLIFGVFGSFPICYGLIETKQVTTKDEFKVYFLGVLLGALFGAILGAIGQYLLWRPRVALRKIRTACRNYAVQSVTLAEVAENHRGIVRRAALRVSQELP
ncbi:MAG TPA: hypothetical protein VGJ05_05640 [Fimbriiglobus sp.]